MDGCGAGGVGALEGVKAFAEAMGVESGDAEDAVAALRAAGTAGEPVAAASDRVRKRGIDNLYQLRVPSREHI